MPSSALDFFAGSGLVRLGLEPDFHTIWANDICPKKAAVYNANEPLRPLHLSSIADVEGARLPAADLAWASFPCQDLSLAGNLIGIRKGTRSGLFWEWIRVLDELCSTGQKPAILVAENVVGFLISRNGTHFRHAYRAIRDLGYVAGALVIDARQFVPQSRPRAFIVAVDERIPLHDLAQINPGSFHPESVKTAAAAVSDSEWVWWSVPPPSGNIQTLADICERMAPCDSEAKTRKLRAMLSPHNKRKLLAQIRSGHFTVGTGYRRTRPLQGGGKAQRLELRFDGIAGCLRTPQGGSSRQVVVIVDGHKVRTRLLTVRECGRLMGAPDTYEISGSYNDGYRAMGDAVAVPVVRWLTRHLLAPLAARAESHRTEIDSAA